MSRVFVSNIPEKFTAQDLMNLLQQANIPCSYPEPLKILKSKRFRADGSSTGRFVVLNFESDTLAATAIEAINMMVLTVDSKETNIRATPFIANFRHYLENPISNLVIYNIPTELATNDLKDLFAEFGDVLSAIVKKPDNKKKPATANPSAMGYVLFKREEEAKAAMEQANGKFLGPNQLYIQMYQTLQQRMANNKDVQILNVPLAFTDAEVRNFVAEKLEMTTDEIFDGVMTLAKDTRPEEVNSHCQQAIFSCKTKEIAQAVVDKINSLGAIVLPGSEIPISIRAKLTRGMIAFNKNLNSNAKRELYSESGKNIQVFGLQVDVAPETVKEFFSQYGKVVEVSAPKRTDVNPDIFHYNVLFENAEDAAKAIQNGKADEEKAEVRIAREGGSIRVQKYENKKEVQSTKPRQANAGKQNYNDTQ